MRVKHPRIRWYTLLEAAKYVGEGEDRAAARRVQRVLKQMGRRERRALLRRDGHGRTCPLLEAEPTLRRAYAHRFDPRDHIESMVREQMKGLEDEIRIAKKERRALGARILKIERRISTPVTCPP